MKNIIVIVSIFLILISACTNENKVSISDSAPWYEPTILEIKTGDTVTFDDTMAAVVHPVNTLSGPEEFSSGHFKSTWEYEFTKPGIYHYFCPIHPYMQGFIAVDAKVDESSIPAWLKQWPPETANLPVPGDLPSESGIGEVWLDAQFQKIDGKDKPGAVIVIDAETWDVKKVIDDKRLNNPHNMWLSPNKNHVLQTNWFDNYLSVIDRYTGLLIKHIYVGESPAHVMTANGNIYVTLQGADGIAVLDGATYEVKETFRTIEGEHSHDDEHKELGRGPHGNWMNKDENLMAVAFTEVGSVSVWDLSNHKKIFEYETDPLPLFAGLSQDGKFAWTASLATGKFYAFDIDKKELIKEFIVGKSPIQSVPSQDGKYILVALSGDGVVAIIDGKTFELVKTLPSGSGAHGVIYGPKKNGGWYAYVSNKFVPWITVIDMEKLEVAGYVPLARESLGGQGILAVYE